MRGFEKLDFENLATPSYVVSADLLEENLKKVE